ncbi:MAG TPA: hypothetical protein PKZ07_19320 [Sedimentisphaerales bacterium]|nr:hypothetical protein [Sedimentisphaerales bacterium]
MNPAIVTVVGYVLDLAAAGIERKRIQDAVIAHEKAGKNAAQIADLLRRMRDAELAGDAPEPPKAA